MTQSEARRILSALTETMGKDGVLIVHKDEEPPARGADLPVEAGEPEGPDDAREEPAPGRALRWPKCECGSPKCPDYDALRTKVAERNRRSSRGGI